jgi:hypothetical protein
MRMERKQVCDKQRLQSLRGYMHCVSVVDNGTGKGLVYASLAVQLTRCVWSGSKFVTNKDFSP